MTTKQGFRVKVVEAFAPQAEKPIDLQTHVVITCGGLHLPNEPVPTYVLGVSQPVDPGWLRHETVLRARKAGWSIRSAHPIRVRCPRCAGGESK